MILKLKTYSAHLKTEITKNYFTQIETEKKKEKKKQERIQVSFPCRNQSTKKQKKCEPINISNFVYELSIN